MQRSRHIAVPEKPFHALELLTTPQAAVVGIISRTIMLEAEPTDGGKTGCSASPIANASSVFALALWNGKDPILKERLFGLTGPEGNHGEDVKEQYFYLECQPEYETYHKLRGNLARTLLGRPSSA